LYGPSGRRTITQDVHPNGASGAAAFEFLGVSVVSPSTFEGGRIHRRDTQNTEKRRSLVSVFSVSRWFNRSLRRLELLPSFS
jgi:hypothetical protein